MHKPRFLFVELALILIAASVTSEDGLNGFRQPSERKIRATTPTRAANLNRFISVHLYVERAARPDVMSVLVHAVDGDVGAYSSGHDVGGGFVEDVHH